MAKDNFSDTPGDQEYQDDNFYDEAPQEAESDALEEDPAQWEQPTDDYVEEGSEEEAATAAAAEEEDDMYAEGPAEEDYIQQTPEEHEDYGAHEGEDAPGTKKSDKKPGFGFGAKGDEKAVASAPSALMRYLPYVGGGVAALLVAFFGFQQFGSMFSGSPSQPVADAQAPEMQATENTSGNPAPPQPQTWDANPSAAQQQAAQQPVPPPAQQPAQDNQAAQMLGLGSAPLPAAEAAASQPAAAQMPVNAPSATANASASPMVAELEGRIVSLNQQIEQMRQTQTDLEQKLQAAQGAQGAHGNDNEKKALEDRIAQLEQKLAQASSSSASSADDAGSINAPSRAERAPRAARVNKSTDFVAAKSKTTSKAVAKKAKRSPEGDVENYGSQMSAVGWVLRSATPGAAWLSQGPYSSDLRRVVPGDKVPGLGTITSVRQVAGRWLVEGTQGSVR